MRKKQYVCEKNFTCYLTSFFQFDQFKKGFDMIAQHSPLRAWFRPEELEKLIVGSPKLDFVALQSVTRYDNGYTVDTPVIT